MPKEPRDKRHQGGQSDEPAQHHHGSTAEETAAINETFKAFAKKHNEHNEQAARRERIQFRIEVAVAIGVAFNIALTGGLLIAGALQASYSGSQVKASFDQIAIMEDTEHRQLRAYVGVVIPPEGPALYPVTPQSIPNFRFTARNYGQTPAYKVAHESGMSIRAYPLPRDNKYTIDDIPLLTVPNPITIFPGAIDPLGITLLSKRALTEQEIGLFQAGNTARLYVWGTINYVDAFTNPHYTNFCFGFFNPTAKNIQYEPCNEHTDSN
jgi:hypothetical protein